jgi:hypothetical protein
VESGWLGWVDTALCERKVSNGEDEMAKAKVEVTNSPWS